MKMKQPYLPLLVLFLLIALSLRLVSAAHKFETRVIAAEELQARGMTAMYVMPRNYTRQFERVTLERFYVTDATTRPPTMVAYDVPETLLVRMTPFENQYILVVFKPEIMTQDGKPLSHIEIRYPVNHLPTPGGSFNTFTTR